MRTSLHPPVLRSFAVAEGDLISYINVWRAWEESGRNKRWAVAHRVMHRNMLRAADIRNQACTGRGEGGRWELASGGGAQACGACPAPISLVAATRSRKRACGGWASSKAQRCRV